MTEEAQESWIGITIGDRYKLETLLGRGGMSSVYKGHDPKLQRSVAIKLIHRHLSEREEWVKRFEQEATAVAQLRHPSIIQVYDFDRYKRVYYIVMEYVPGETLDKRLAALKSASLRMPLAEALQIMMTLCDAVAYAHDRNIIHRDLKPSNIMMNLLGQPVLMDFGIAKLLDGSQVQTATGTTMGTAAYMAPEQVTGKTVDHRSDLYSLGVILYEMVNGAPPFEGKSALTVMMKHVNEEVPDIRLRNSNLPDAVTAIINKALSKEPADRFQSGLEMAEAIRMLLGSNLTQTFGDPTAPGYYPPNLTPTFSRSGLPFNPQGTVPKKVVSGSDVTQVQAFPAVQEPILQEPIGQKTAVAPAADSMAKPKRNLVPFIIGGIGLLILIAAGAFLLPRFFQATPSAAGMVPIPAGSYAIGQGTGGTNFAPSQQIALEAFWIDRYEITNAQYATFLADSGEDTPPAHWPNGNLPAGQEQHPAQGVTWDMADGYCRWADKRLPSEAEWEVAARGGDSWLYPWGNNASVVQPTTDSAYPVGSILANRSPFAIYDMAGNVWEWVDEPYTRVNSDQKVLRGGAYDFQKDMTYRLMGDPEVATMYATAGFRCAASDVQAGTEESAVIINDDFTNPESGWQEIKEGHVLTGYHPPDSYHVQADAPGQISTAYFGSTFGNISLETAVFVHTADTPAGDFRYGLVARRVGDQFYAFAVSPRSQKWYVLKGTTDALQEVQEGNIDSLRGLTTADTLRLDAAGPNLVFAINNQVVAQLHDADYAEGDIGFIVQTVDETRAHIHYDSVVVSNLGYVPVTDGVVAEPVVVPTAVNASEPTPTTSAESVPTAEPTAVAAEEVTSEETTAVSGQGMSQVKGGLYTAGNTAIELADFWLDTYEVTNAQYATFLAETGQPEPTYWADESIPGNKGDHPVRSLTWDMANSYCSWASKRLPTEAEWEVAARSPYGWLYPWGNNRNAVRLPNSDTYAVGSIPTNRSYFGLFDMAGNVWEWVDAPFSPNSANNQVMRGGANGFPQDMVYFLSGDPNSELMFEFAGVRCAADLASDELSSNVILNDNFREVAGWDTAKAVVGNYFYGYHPTDFYHMQIRATNDCLRSLRHDLAVDNVMAEAKIFIAATDTENGNFRQGFLVREQNNQFYAFLISPRQQLWQVIKSDDIGLIVLAEGTATTIRGDGQINEDTLFAIANGPELTFFVNGELVSQVYDTGYSSGNVGLMVQSWDETFIHIHFDTLKLWQLPEGIETPSNVVTVSTEDAPFSEPCQGIISAENVLTTFSTYTVLAGDTFSGIAAKLNLPLEAVLGANGRTNPRSLDIGQTIIIPQS